MKGGENLDKDILEELYKKYYNTAYLYTLSLCKSKELAEDIIADAFVKAFVSLNEAKSFKYWLLVVCRNLWIDSLRKQKKLSKLPLEDIVLESGDEKLDYKLLLTERNRYIYTSISKLSETYKEVLILFYYGELSIAEISKLTKITPMNVKTLLHRGRKKLKEILEEKDHEFQRSL